MKRVAIDMDEVMADTLQHQLNWLRDTHGYNLEPTTLRGTKPRFVVAPQHAAELEAVMHQGDFFADIPVMPDATRVVAALCERYEVFITTAAMDYPRSCHAKYDWLRRHFAFLDKSRYVFCGDKRIVRADVMIDDNPKNFRDFPGEALLYDSPHNVHIDAFARVRSWEDVATRLLFAAAV